MSELTPYTEEREIDNNPSTSPALADLVNMQLSRRRLMGAGLAGAAAVMLSGCGSDTTRYPEGPVGNPVPGGGTGGGTVPALPKTLNFAPVAKNLNDVVTVAEGYQVSVLYALGDSLTTQMPGWKGDGTESGESYTLRSGDCHDGMHYFGMNNGRFDASRSDMGLLVLNHEYINQTFLHPAGPTVVNGKRTVENEVIKEFNCHGVSVAEIRKDAGNMVSVVKDSQYNRRITATTDMELHGPAAGSPMMVTTYSRNGTRTRGTQNNCGNGYTPWGTYLTCEENFIGYFARADGDDAKRTATEITSLRRYGLPQKSGSRYGWETVTSATQQDLFNRWNASVMGATAADDYRNAPNTFGWIVEIDPFKPTTAPRKRTALGRFAHEDCRVGRVEAGKPVVFYMGDDSRGEYIYKFVSRAMWDPADVNGGYAAGDKYMNDGTLYVAKFAADGTGSWVELTFGKNDLVGTNSRYPFQNQADVLINTRLAADVVGATRMDRPEWCAVNPNNGEVYVTLTNNTRRLTTTDPAASGRYPVDAANPRAYVEKIGVNPTTGADLTSKGNVNGHIIRMKEAGSQHNATTFQWDIYLFGAPATSAANLSGLTDANDFSSPDGMWFDPRGVLWIETDDGAYTYKTNCMLLAALPGNVGDGGRIAGGAGVDTFKGKNPDDTQLMRFLTGPNECEITGIAMTPDLKALFINVQHPGEDSAPNTPNDTASFFTNGT